MRLNITYKTKTRRRLL